MFGKTKPVKLCFRPFGGVTVREENKESKSIADYLENTANFQFLDKNEKFGLEEIDESETGKALGALIYAVLKNINPVPFDSWKKLEILENNIIQSTKGRATFYQITKGLCWTKIEKMDLSLVVRFKE